MKECPNCGAKLIDEASFCLYCMQPVGEKEKVPLPPSRRRGARILIAVSLASFLLIASAVTALVLFLQSRAPAPEVASPAGDPGETLRPDPDDPRVGVYSDAARFREKSEGTGGDWRPEELFFVSENEAWQVYTCPSGFRSCVPTVYFKKDGAEVIVALNDLILDPTRAFRFDEQSEMVEIMRSLETFICPSGRVPMVDRFQNTESGTIRGDADYSLLERVGADEDALPGKRASLEYRTASWEAVGQDNRTFYLRRVRTLTEEEARLDVIFYFTFGGEELP